MKSTAKATLKRFDKIRAGLSDQNSTKTPPSADRSGNNRGLDVSAYCSHFGIEIFKIKEAPGGGTMYCLKKCVFDENHGPNQASIIQRPNGKLSYHCFHDSCKARKWSDARQRISGTDKLSTWMNGTKDSEKKQKHADALVEIGKTAELFKSPDGTKWARFKVDQHLECWPIASKDFRSWIVSEFYQKCKTTPSIMSVKSAIDVLASEAQFGQNANTREVFIRVGSHNGFVYLDLADDAWRAVEITPEGWSVVENPPVCFRRTRGMLPLPEPDRGENFRLLERFANICSEEDLKLIFSWLSFCLNPHGPYPILCLLSGPCSGKSELSRILRNTVDPNRAPTRGLPKSLEDLAVAGHHSWVLCFENLSELSGSLSDAICRMSTGGGFGTREQYTNHGEAIFWSVRPIILNGIPDFVKRADLLDRAIIVRLPFIPRSNRKTVREIQGAFEKLHPAFLGAVLDAAVLALKNLPSVSLSESPRMADFAQWAAAIASALKTDPSEVVRLLIDTQDDALLSMIDTPLPQAVLKLLDAWGGKYEGYVGDLVDELVKHAPAHVTDQSSWPKNPKALQNAMARIVPVLRAAKVKYQEFERTNRGRPVLLERVGPVER